MRIVACVAVVLACAATGASAQSFVDLDFDAADVPLPPGSVSLMPWSQAAPGWSHPAGDGTSDVAWFPNAGYSQSYVLLQAPFGAGAGAYGFGMKSGNFSEDDPSSPFVQAYISQTGRLGTQVTSIIMLSSSSLFEVTLDGTAIAMHQVVLDPPGPTAAGDPLGYSVEWIGDVSAFAGQVVDLRITDLIVTPDPPLLEIDQIEFLPVPEPQAAALLGLGLLAVLFARRRDAFSPPRTRLRRA